MNADDWNRLAYHSRVLVHHVSRLMGALTQPMPSSEPGDSHEPREGREGRDQMLHPIASDAGIALEALLAHMARAPELAAHVRTIQRFDISLGAWRRTVGEGSPLMARYQTALLQQAAQVVTSCLHVAALSESESARVLVARNDLGGRASPPPP